MTRRFLYFSLLGPLALAIAWLVSPLNPKLRASFRERRGVWRRFARAIERRHRGSRLVWFHVASAGEFLQAEPLLRRFRAAGWQLAVSLSSVSGQRWIARISGWPELVWADLLPWDLYGASARLYQGLAPSLVVYLQADLWPGLVWSGWDQGVPQALVVGRLAPDSPKLRRGLQGAYARDLYGKLALILAATESDGEQLQKLVLAGAPIRVGGDPGTETVLNRVREAQDAGLPPTFAQAPVIVCGSTWPADEAHLLPALVAAMEKHRETCAVIAPHDPTEKHLQSLESRLATFGVCRLSQTAKVPSDSHAPRIILVDSVGKLAGLYRAGRIAYVGGAFSTGVHNVAEPAAAGLPVLFGPRHANSPIAAALISESVAFPIQSAQEAEHVLSGFLDDPARCAMVGATGSKLVEARAGAAQRTFDALLAIVASQ